MLFGRQIQKFITCLSSLFVPLLLTLQASPAHAQQTVSISLNSTGLASLSYNGINFLSYGDLRLKQVTFQNSDSSVSYGNISSTVAIDTVHQTQTRTYDWGSIVESYSTSGSTLAISLTVNNTSPLPMKGIWFEPLGLQFPSTIAEFAAGYPLMLNTLGQPAVQMLTYSTGAVALADDDNLKPLLLGYPYPVNSPNATVPIAVVTDRYDACTCFPTIIRPIPAGATDTFHISLRFGPTGSTLTTLAGDVYQSFAADYPFALPAWPDHRPIGSLHLATNTAGLSGWTTNPRGYLNDTTIDVTTPAGVADFQQRMLGWADNDIAVLQGMNAQGMIAWDLEGQQFGPYNGDPTQVGTLAPEMDPIADEFFRRFTDAGFRVGVTIRPQQLTVAPDLSSSQQDFLDDPTQLLIKKAKYAHDRWGATLFYVDSNVKSWTDQTAIDPMIFKNLQAALPDSIFFPEHSTLQYSAYSVPYFELQYGLTGTSDTTRFTYPNAFSMIYTADADIQGHFDALVDNVKQGDIILYRSWYDEEPANELIREIYQAAGQTATSITISVNPPGPTVALGQVEQFNAVVAGTGNQQVTWSLLNPGVGTLSSSGLYTAPATMPAQKSISVRATSVADPSKIATVSIAFTPSVGISMNPKIATLAAGKKQQFNAPVTGTTNQQVTWTILSGGAGTLSSSGLYTAPASIAAQQTVTIMATSAADTSKNATATITLMPSGVSVNPVSTWLTAGQTQQFSVTVDGTANQQVTWAILNGGAGTLSTSGLYTAPSSIATQQTVTIQATSAADATKTGTATVTLNPIVGISVNPLTKSLSAGQTQQFTATVTGTTNQQVTWAILNSGAGTLSTAGLYTAPSTITAQQTVTVQATSAADNTKTATATVTLTPTVGISVNPLTKSLSAGQTQQFTATVTGSSNQGVTWALLNGGAGTISTAGLYTAPGTIASQQNVTVQATSAADGTKTATATVTLTPPPAPTCGSPSTNSFTGCYYNDINLGNFVFSRVDPQINFNWNNSGPGGNLPATNYSVRWQGYFTFEAAPYTFTMSSDDGGRLYVDGHLVIDDWSVHAARNVTQSYTLSAGSHLVELDYFQAGGDATVSLTWVNAAPPPAPSCGNPGVNTFSGCYFKDTTLGTTNGVAFSRTDSQINFDWSANGPGGNLGTSNYSVKWLGNFDFNAGPYTFSVTSDDGARLYIDGQLVTGDWSTHAAYTLTQSRTITAGTHLIELDYYQAGGGAYVNLSWAGAQQAVGISVNPTTASLTAGQTQQFAATVTGTANQQVTWTVLSSGLGSISSSGLYTAPSSVSSQQNVTVQATSAADVTKTATASITLNPSSGGTCGAPTTNGFTGCYYRDTTLGTSAGLAFSRVDPQVSFDWSAAGPGGGLGTTNYSVKWQGNFTFNAGSYNFTLATDDGSRLYVDGQLIIDDWSTHAAYTINQGYTMTAGTHLIELDYYQAGGGASASLSWAASQQQVGIKVNPSAPSLSAGQTRQFTAPVTGSANQQVSWMILSNGPGSISSSGLYTAPSSVSSQQTVTVQATSAADPTKTATAAITLTPPAVSASCGAPSTNSFTGCYFGDVNLGSSAGLAFSRVDPQINFDWSATGPGGNLGNSNYSVKWQGNFTFNAGPYTFTLSTDDGSRLYVDGHLVIDDWSTHAAYTITQSYTMTAGTHLIEFDYFQAGGGALATLSWNQPPSCGAASTNAFTGCYFGDTSLGSNNGVAFSRVDPQINFNWTNTTPGGSLGGYNYSVRWQGNFTFNAGPYTFALATDDGSRLYVDGQLVIDNWSVHPASTITQKYTMTAGSHLIELDYFQAGGDAVANLSWTPSP